MGEVVRIEYELVWLFDGFEQYLYLTQCKVDAKGSQSAKSVCIFQCTDDGTGQVEQFREDIVEDYLLHTKHLFADIVKNTILEEEKEDDVSGYPDISQYEDFDVIRRVDEYILPGKGSFYDEVTI